MSKENEPPSLEDLRRWRTLARLCGVHDIVQARQTEEGFAFRLLRAGHFVPPGERGAEIIREIEQEKRRAA